MKKFTLFFAAAVLMLYAAVANAGAPIGWNNNTVTTSYTGLEMDAVYTCANHTILNTSGTGYYIAKDASGTDEKLIPGTITSFQLGKCCPRTGKILLYVRVASGSIELTVLSNSNAQD